MAESSLIEDIPSYLWDGFIVAVVLIALATVAWTVFCAGAWVVATVTREVLESAVERVLEKRTTLVPSLLTLIGAVSVPAASGLVKEFSTVGAWVLAVTLALMTFMGSALASNASGGDFKTVRGVGYALLVVPLLVLLCLGIVLRTQLWDAVHDLRLWDKVLLAIGLTMYMSGIVAGLFMIHAKAAREKEALSTAL